MRNQRKTFEKMTTDRNFYLFWGPKWHKNWTSEAHILHTYKSTCNEHVKQYWCEISENFLRKLPKTWFFTYLWENGPKIGPLRPIFHTLMKVLAINMRSNNDVKPVKTFCESDLSLWFWLILGSKMARKLGLWGPYYTHPWKNLQWAYKTRLMWIQRKVFNTVSEWLNLAAFLGTADEVHIVYISRVIIAGLGSNTYLYLQIQIQIRRIKFQTMYLYLYLIHRIWCIWQIRFQIHFFPGPFSKHKFMNHKLTWIFFINMLKSAILFQNRCRALILIPIGGCVCAPDLACQWVCDKPLA